MTVTHRLEDDGHTLVSTARTPAGVWTARMSWDDPQTARENVEQAKTLMQERFDAELAIGMQAGEGVYLRRWPTRIGTFWWFVSSGPPVWWLPRIGVTLRRSRVELRAGWILRAYAATWEPS